ncbi:MAG: hypothetical protein JRF33_16495 [Deltaproteobacteria bacterium]|nr:hypothetical protein [Deltaproteobacteria bacterium]
MLPKLNLRDIRILAGNEFVHLLRSGPGILALSILGLYAGWVLSKLVEHADFINSLAAGGMSQESTVVLAIVKWLADVEDEVLRNLLENHSPFITLLFVMVAGIAPWVSMMAGLDQNAGDIGSKGIRFMLPRTSRANLMMGRFVGTAVFWTTVQVLLGLTAIIVALAMDEHNGMASIVMDGIWLILALSLIGLPFIAFMAICSVTTGNPLLSVTMGIGCYFAIALIGGLGGWLNENLGVIRFAFPSPLRIDLMLGSFPEIIVAAVAMIVYAFIYLVSAGAILRKRDL